MNGINEIHFFDLDGTLWSMSSMIWIIDKEYPSKPLMKLTYKEYVIIRSGIYRKDDILVSYNGQDYNISKNLLEKLQKIKKSITKERIGFSFIELLDNKFIKKVKFLIYNIYHLRSNKNIHIGFLSARWDRHKDGAFLNQLRLQLKDLDIDVDKIFFVSDNLEYNVSEKAAYRKCQVLLEHLVGFKIDKNKFVSIKQDKYDNVYFYDDEIKNINICQDVQNYFNELILNTEDEVFNIIKKRVQEKELKLITNWTSNNEYNRFITNEIILTEPVKYPIKIEKLVYKFNEFINEKKNEKSISDDLYSFINNLLPKNTNCEVRTDDECVQLIFQYDDQPLLSINIDNEKQFNIVNYYEEETIVYNTKDIKKYIKDYFDFFYDEYKSIHGVNSLSVIIPVLNTEKYSQYIYDLITKMRDSDNIENLKHIKQYLNEETYNKLKHYIDANNFDLI